MDVVSYAKVRLLVLFTFAALALNACGYSTSSGSAKVPATSAKCESSAVENQYVVRMKDGTQKVYKHITREALIEKVIEPNLEMVDFAEQDQRVSTPQTPAILSAQTQLAVTPDWGQTMVEANAVWTQSVGGSGVIVAVIDSGMERTHPQLKDQIFVNPGETGVDSLGRDKATNGVDDDGNGFIDDVSGWDFDMNRAPVSDGTGHGTHVGGIIAAAHTSGSQVRGLAPQAKLLPLDFMDDSGSGNISDAIRAMYYAAAMGAKVVNASWGGAPCSKNLQTAIADLGARGVLFVSASGNRGISLDSQPEYPAAFGMSSQITVGASTARDYAAIYSNYSTTLVNLVAPGDEITSTYPGGTTRALSGTSMATPFVAGAAALLFGLRPHATVTEVKAALLNSVDAGPFDVETRGRLNVRKAVIEIQKLP